jgi:DNA polymerase III delta prime subunit
MWGIIMIEKNDKEFLWVEKYRPNKIDDCVLPERMKDYFKQMISCGEIQNTLLVGGPGVGKTTSALAICKELGLDSLLINCSENGNIDTLRTTIRSFASTVSFTSPYKVVILDEADGLNACFGYSQLINRVRDGIIVYEQIGDLLDKGEFTTLSYDFKQKEIIQTSAIVYKLFERELFKVVTKNGSMYCTKDHPFFDEYGNEVFLSDLKLFNVDVGYDDVIEISSMGVQTVYDVYVDNEVHNFILSNGVVAHNSSTQPALRGFIEEFSKNCRFIFTANFRNKIIEPLRSRLVNVDFTFSKVEKQQMAITFDRRIREILSIENIDYDKKVLAKVLIKYFPDFRKVLNELQRHSMSGNIDEGILANISSDSIQELFSYLKDTSKWNDMRRWVVTNSDNEFSLITRAIYENAQEYIKPSSFPQLVLTLGEYLYKNSFVADQEINTVAMLTEIMSQVEFK